MASLQNKCGAWYCQFLYHGKRHTFGLGKVAEDEAQAKASQVGYLLMRLRQNLLHLPPAMDIVTFLQFDGNPPQEAPEKGSLTLAALRDRYLDTHRNGSLEKSTLEGIELHFKHLAGTLGERFPVEDLSMADLQQHVDRRAKKKGLRGKLSPATIHKEIITLRTVWNWAVQMGLLTGKFPYKGLRYPKFAEKPPFQTWNQIERRIKAGGLSDAEKRTLWDCLYLQSAETADLLAHVKARAAQPWVYPLFCFAAYTGTRRAEMLRVLVADVDFDGKTVLIREKKRAKGKTTTRRIPLTPLLAGVLKDWLAAYPGGQYLFCQSPMVVRSKTKRMASTPITHDEAHDHFKRVVRGSKWEVLRGYHVLRHSFISACASKGIDQRLIDEWTGHATDEQRKRYRHLYPSTQQEAILSVFGQ
jgi:integrase